jgi:hypothetical protein
VLPCLLLLHSLLLPSQLLHPWLLHPLLLPMWLVHPWLLSLLPLPLLLLWRLMLHLYLLLWCLLLPGWLVSLIPCLSPWSGIRLCRSGECTWILLCCC